MKNCRFFYIERLIFFRDRTFKKRSIHIRGQRRGSPDTEEIFDDGEGATIIGRVEGDRWSYYNFQYPTDVEKKYCTPDMNSNV